MAKTKTAKEQPVAAPSTYSAIPLSQIVVSPFEPQARRRARYVQSEIKEIADSIMLNGQLQPIKVRPVKIDGIAIKVDGEDRFEIVFGERRFLACSLNKAATINAFIEDLDDEAAFRQQTAENDERQEPAPIDQAANYAFLKRLLEEKRGTAVTVEEIAEVIGKPVKHVANRLVLNNLIDEAKADIEAGFLPIGHGYALARYPLEVQGEIYQRMYFTEWDYQSGKSLPNKARPVTLNELLTWIQKNVHLRLSDAVFDRKSETLRADGLACVKCPERTGANANLFEKDVLGKNDCCLNKRCFMEKSMAHVDQRRQAIALDAEKLPSHVALVHTHGYGTNGDYLTKNYFTLLDSEIGSGDWCEFKETAINIVENHFHGFAEEVLICRSTECKVHNEENKPARTPTPAKSAEEIEAEAKLKRAKENEERFDIKVGQVVRMRVMKQAAEKFGDAVAAAEVPPVLDLVPVIVRLWQRAEYPYNQMIEEILGLWDVSLTSGTPLGNSQASQIAALTPAEQARLLFLFTHGHIGAMYAKSYTSQAPVKAIAEKWGIDYQLLDAAERMNHATKKEKDRFRKYQQEIEQGNRNARLPRMYTNEYVAKD